MNWEYDAQRGGKGARFARSLFTVGLGFVFLTSAVIFDLFPQAVF